MDNDGKIKDLAPKTRNVFLDWKNLEIGSKDLYDLEKEFALTRKNKNYIVMIAILLFLIAVTGTAYAVTKYIQEAGRIVPVQISDFEDVNLKDILDVAKNYEFQLKNARESLDQLKADYSEAVEKIRGKYARDISIIRESNETDQVKNRRIAAAAVTRDNDIAAADAEYNSAEEMLDQEIEEVEAAMASYDATVLERARKQEEILNNQKVMADLQLQDTVSSYEKRIELLESRYDIEIASLKSDNARLVRVLRDRHRSELKAMYDKYDPVYSSAQILEILSKKTEAGIPAYAADDAVKSLERNRAAHADEIRLIRKEADDIKLMLDRLSEVPFENSNAQALKRIFEKKTFIEKGYETIWGRAGNIFDEKNRLINYFSNALDYYIRETGVSGYVIDADDSSELFIYMNRILRIKTGDTAYVFRSDDEPIGEIEFYYIGENLFARELVSSERFSTEEKNIRPMDRILVRIQ